MESFTITKLLQLNIDLAVSNMWTIAAALAAVGIFSMALVDILAVITRARYRFNQEIFRRWLRKNNFERVEQEIVLLSTGGSKFLLYSLPVERMIGQINAAAQIALAYPSKYSEIVRALGAKANSDDLKDVIEIAEKPERGSGNPPTEHDANAGNDDLRKFSDARNRVSNMIQRNLDALQIQIKGNWDRGRQIAAVVISISLIMYFLEDTATDAEDMAKLICFAVFGGIVAPVAKDVLGILKSVKERSR